MNMSTYECMLLLIDRVSQSVLETCEKLINFEGAKLGIGNSLTLEISVLLVTRINHVRTNMHIG